MNRKNTVANSPGGHNMSDRCSSSVLSDIIGRSKGVFVGGKEGSLL